MITSRNISIQCLKGLRRLYNKKLSSKLLSARNDVAYIQPFYSTLNQNNIIQSNYNDVIIPKIDYFNYIFENQDKYARRVCMVNGDTGQSFTYEDVLDKTKRLASALSRLGVSKGDVVCLIAPNCPEFLISFAALAAIGAVSTTVNTSYTSAEILKQLNDSKPCMVITHSLLLDKVRAVLDAAPYVRETILMDKEGEGIVPMANLFKDDGKGMPNVTINPDEDLLTMPYSSGTTGLPKGVMLTHRNVVANLQQFLHPDLSNLGKDPDLLNTFIGILPMFHIYGMVCVMSMSACTGSRLVTLNGFDPVQYIQTIQKFKPTFLHTVPPLLAFLTSTDHAPPSLLSSTHSVTCGAAPLGPALLERFLSKFGQDICFQEGYGMTEASPLTHLSPPDRCVIGSCGTAVPNTLTKLVDLETGVTLNPRGAEGELCVKGPQVMKGYYRNEAATRDMLCPEGWLRTGDIARVDEEGNVFIVDRLKELIKVKGLQVAPAELEDLLRKHPQVLDVAVIGVEDEKMGEVPRAFVVPSKQGVTEEDIARFVEEKVAAHKRLAGGVVFIEQVPKSDTGKILRRMLK